MLINMCDFDFLLSSKSSVESSPRRVFPEIAFSVSIKVQWSSRLQTNHFDFDFFDEFHDFYWDFCSSSKEYFKQSKHFSLSSKYHDLQDSKLADKFDNFLELVQFMRSTTKASSIKKYDMIWTVYAPKRVPSETPVKMSANIKQAFEDIQKIDLNFFIFTNSIG